MLAQIGCIIMIIYYKNNMCDPQLEYEHWIQVKTSNYANSVLFQYK